MSHPRGNLVTFWNLAGGYAGCTEVSDGCGLSAGEGAGELLLTGGTGERWWYRVTDGHTQALSFAPSADARWDNHLVRV